jgi:hypothetical protein
MNERDQLRKDLRRLGFDGLAVLVHAGRDIEQLSPYHFRIEGRLDVYPNLRRRSWKWNNVQTTERGDVDGRHVAAWAVKYLEENPPIAKDPSAPADPVEVPAADGYQQLHNLGKVRRVEPEKLREILRQLYIQDRPFEELWAWIDFELKASADDV